MDIRLIRKYHATGTNGKLYNGTHFICFTIELPWLQNRRNVSCIPEGRYPLIKRYTKERGWHLLVTKVTDRDGIIIHPANDAQRELKGCIAPVSSLTGPGKGWHSRTALEKLEALVFQSLDQSEEVFLIIKS